MSDLVNLFYGNNPPAAAAGEPTREPTPFEEFADAFYDGTPADAPAGGELYSPATHLRGKFAANRAPLADALGLTPKQLQTEEREFVQTVRAEGLEFGTAERLYDLVTEARVAASREGATPGAQTLTWTEDLRRDLREQVGADEASDLMARMTAVVERSPRFRQLIARGGLGSDPRLVALLLDHVRSRRI